ncbi:MAG: MFS transporter, partial [Bacteroidetes bacterium]|nr:MFS transporter [Bacteroidota bacterium]
SSRTFWIVAGLCMFYYISIFTFQRYAVWMLDSRLLDAPMPGNQIFMFLPLGAAILTPLLGFFLDFRGRGATMLILGSLLMVACHSIFALAPDAMFTFTVAVAAIVVLGVSFSLVPAALWPAIPKFIEPRMLGTAFALIFWIQNIGLTVAPFLIGYILEVTNPYVDVIAGDVHNFKVPMLIFASFGVFALILSFLLKRQDKIHGYGLELPNKQK